MTSEPTPRDTDVLDPAPARGSARLPLLALAVGGFTIGTTEFAAMGLLPLISDALHVSIPVAGHVISAYALGVVVGAPLLTVAAARMDRRLLLLALMAAYTVGNLLSALAPSIGWLEAGRFLAGMPHGAFFGVGAVMGSYVAGPGRRGQAVGTMMAGLTIANIAGVPLSTVLGEALGWRASFVAMGVLGLVTLAGLVRWLPPLAVHDEASVRSELGALRNGRLWVAAVAGAVGFGGMFAVYSYVSPLVTDAAGMSRSWVPLVQAAFGVGMTGGALLGGRLADRSVIGTVVAGFAGTIVVLVLVGTTGHQPVAAVLGVVLLGLTSQTLGTATQAYLMDLSPAAPSLGAALSHSALNTGNAAGAWVGGLVIAAGRGYLAPAWAGAAMATAGLVVVGLTTMRRVRRGA